MYHLSGPQCTPEQISSDLQDELMFQLEHDHNLQKVSELLLRLLPFLLLLLLLLLFPLMLLLFLLPLLL